ncbi:DUF2493 domain-containing protein [Nonomuraea sp. NPDC049646]|uniref:DUF2493 domain-containing protein n=1 Tax=unclassified Nonomuraea TaxID=2593643 RepID=UPI0037AB90CC
MTRPIPPSLDELAEHCTRCEHQNGVHTDTGTGRWGWAIYDDVFMNASGACSHPGCTCQSRTSDPAAAPAPQATFTPPAPLPAQPCAFFAFGDKTRCGVEPARLFANGWRCSSHTPAALAGVEEAGEGACAPTRHYCTSETRCATWAWQQQPWRLLCTGGRDRTDKPRIWAALDDVHRIHPILTVVHGACYPKPEHGTRPDRSADWLIHQWCQHAGVKEETHPADWRKHGKAAGIIQNSYLVQLGASEMLAFPGAGGGTYDCMRKAAAAGIPLRPIRPHQPAVAHG